VEEQHAADGPQSRQPSASLRAWHFSSKPPPQGSRAVPVNDGPWKEFATQIQGVQAPSEEALDADNPGNYLFRAVHSPRELEHNAFMPGVTNVWMGWTATEFGLNGRMLYDLDLLYDARGNLSVSRAFKATSAGEPGEKMAYKVDASLMDLREIRSTNALLELV